MAFSYDEQKKIIPTLNEPETSTIWDKCLYYLTPDSVFLLNRSEVNKYLKTTSEKKHIATKYAINEATLRNGPIDPGFYNTWFLRPQDRFPYDYSYIDENGIINYPLSSAEGNPFVGIMPYSVRPAMWISLE